MSDDTTHYPDFPPDTLGDLKAIERLPTMKKRAPKIAWGDAFLSWSIEKKLDHAMRLAEAMNHAADMMQTERNKLLEVCAAQEEKLKSNVASYLAQGDLMHSEIAKQGEREQEMARRITELQTALRPFARRARIYRADDTKPIEAEDLGITQPNGALMPEHLHAARRALV